jgi:hypothetical protein
VGEADGDDVAARLQGEHRGGVRRPAVGHRLHLEVVREHHAVVLELAAQDAVDHGLGDRSRILGVQLRVEDVRHHDRRDPGRDRALEGTDLHVFQARAALLDRRQREMGIEVGVAVPGKVLGRRHHAAALKPLDHGDAQSSHPLGVVAERAVADDGIVRVRVDVHDRREIALDPRRRAFRGQGRAHASREVFGPDAPERAHGWPDRPGRAHARHPAPFLVHRDEQRGVVAGVARRLLELAVEPRDLFRIRDVPREQDDVADPELTDQLLDVGGGLEAVEADHEALPDSP